MLTQINRHFWLEPNGAYDVWTKLPQRFTNCEMDVFQIMPNHIHAIIALNETLVGAGLAPARDPDDNRADDYRAEIIGRMIIGRMIIGRGQAPPLRMQLSAPINRWCRMRAWKFSNRKMKEWVNYGSAIIMNIDKLPRSN